VYKKRQKQLFCIDFNLLFTILPFSAIPHFIQKLMNELVLLQEIFFVFQLKIAVEILLGLLNFVIRSASRLLPFTMSKLQQLLPFIVQ
jgi:hypothetical protein